MTRRVFLAAAAAILIVGAILRTVWLTSDPPTTATVGVVWHDEGAWVHNARNRALWGAWRTDNWNPMFLTPVFTGLEYGAFRMFGVGTWQARTVPVLSGLFAIGFLMAGLAAAANRRAALFGGLLLAGNYVFVMWNRAALMESTMTSLVVVSWASLALARKRPAWGVLAGVAAVLAWFTKASAAFYLAAIGIEVILAVVKRPRGSFYEKRKTTPEVVFVIAGLVAATVLIGVVFVVPHWSEYRFYNWQMSVVRKPSYTLHDIRDRATWIPIVHDFFMWMWPVLAIACVGILGIVSRWRTAAPAERVLVLWVIVGLIELAVHDSGNERRYVMFMPALIALAAIVIGTGRPGISAPAVRQPLARWMAVPLLLGLGYLAAGSLLRVGFLTEIHGGDHPFHRVVMLAAGVSLGLTLALIIWWQRVADWLAQCQIPAGAGVSIVAATLLVDAWHISEWARHRSTFNYQASIEVGRLLAPGALVHGKLANGLALENRIRPIFIGHGFGNYDDRLQRDDVRYILTYVSPKVGFESQQGSDMIQDLLDRYPARRVIATLVVNETGPADRAELIDKAPGSHPRAPD